MLIKKATKDERFGQLKTDRGSINSIQAHSFEDETPGVPRSKSLPSSRNNQITKSHIPPLPHREQSTHSIATPQQGQSPASNSSETFRRTRCVLL